MPRFTGKYTRTFSTRATPDQVKDLLSDPNTWRRHQDEIKQSTVVNDHTLDIVLKEHTHGPAKFQGQYRCRWTRTDSGTRWDSDPDANFAVNGQVSVQASGSGASVTWTESVEADVSVPRLMVRVVRPIAETLMGKGLDRFCQKMQTILDAQA